MLIIDIHMLLFLVWKIIDSENSRLGMLLFKEDLITSYTVTCGTKALLKTSTACSSKYDKFASQIIKSM